MSTFKIHSWQISIFLLIIEDERLIMPAVSFDYVYFLKLQILKNGIFDSFMFENLTSRQFLKKTTLVLNN